MVYRVTTFYRFVTLTDLTAKKATWQSLGQHLGLKGTMLLATEGVSGEGGSSAGINFPSLGFGDNCHQLRINGEVVPIEVTSILVI